MDINFSPLWKQCFISLSLIEGAYQNERLCFSILSDYARVLRRWKAWYAPQSPAEALDKRFVEACHKLDEAEYYLDILCAGDSYERAEVVSYLLTDGRLDKLKEKINGRDAA